MTDQTLCEGSGALHVGDAGDDYGYCARCGKTWPVIQHDGLFMLVAHRSPPLSPANQEWDVILYLVQKGADDEPTGETVALPYGRAVSGVDLIHAVTGALHVPKGRDDPFTAEVHSVLIMPTGGQAAKEAAVRHYTQVRDGLLNRRD